MSYIRKTWIPSADYTVGRSILRSIRIDLIDSTNSVIVFSGVTADRAGDYSRHIDNANVKKTASAATGS